MKRLSKAAAAAFLSNPVIADKLSIDTRDAIRSNKVSLRAIVAYVRKEITFGSGSVPLVDTKTDKTTGVSNLDANRLPAYRNIVFDRISLGYATNAEAGKETEVSYASTLPNSLRNAELEIKQDGNTIISIPCSEFDADHAFTHEGERFVDLGGEYLIREEKAFEINIKFPDGATGTAHDYVEVRLSGIETNEK